jgi:hypothetical protein
MTTITPNRQGLKDLSAFNVDTQFCQQYGAQVFNYSGELTPQYQQICVNLTNILNDLSGDIQSILQQIPKTA